MTIPDTSRPRGEIVPGHVDLPQVGVTILGEPGERSELMRALAKSAVEDRPSTRVYHALVSLGGESWERYTVYANSLDEAKGCLTQRFGPTAQLSFYGIVESRQPR